MSAAISFLVTATLIAVVMDRLTNGGGVGRPQSGTHAGFALAVSVDQSKPQLVRIAPDGGGCDVLERSAFLLQTCLLATLTSPPHIGAAALGLLNSENGPAVEALIWRAWLSKRALDCADGGLLGTWLARCQAAAQGADYSVQDGVLRVTVLANGT